MTKKIIAINIPYEISFSRLYWDNYKSAMAEEKHKKFSDITDEEMLADFQKTFVPEEILDYATAQVNGPITFALKEVNE
jgi:hypothetical protein